MAEIETIDILLVDDRDENLLALETVLSSPSYHLIKVTSGTEALRYLLDHEPALILMDVQMPEMDGFETAKLIKRNERTRDIPIIFVTAINQDEHYVHQGYNHGAVDYIYKPYDAYILKSKVAVFAELARKTNRLIQIEKKLADADRKDREQQIVRLELKSIKREQAEQKKYLDLVEGISHGIVWSADADSLVISFVSPSAETILGYSTEQWVSENAFFVEHLHPDERDQVLKAIHLLKQDGQNRDLDHRFLVKGGKEIWVHTGLRIAKKESGGQEIRGLSVEITKIKEAEETLRMNKKHSDFLSEASLLLSQSLDFESSLSLLTELAVPQISEWAAIHLLKGEESKEYRLVALSHPDSVQKELTRKVLQEYAEIPELSPQNLSHLSDALLTKISKNSDHAKIFQSLHLKSMIVIPLISHGITFGYLTLANTRLGSAFHENDYLMAQDLGRRMTMAFDNASFYQQAQTAIQMRDEFLSVASHELKTPLTPLKLQIQMLMRILRGGALSEIKPEKLEKILLTSDRQLDRLSLLIDELLDIARISSGRLEMNTEEFNLNELIHEVLDRFDGQISSAKCEISLNLPENGHLVTWDRFRMEQVFINLLTNAIKYGQGKPIHISTSRDHSEIKISVRDHGIGIEKKDQARIFGRFERAVSANHFAGLGLGLYIVTQVLEAHGGKIEVSSEFGSGSTFTITVPVNITEKAASSPPWQNELAPEASS